MSSQAIKDDQSIAFTWVQDKKCYRLYKSGPLQG